MSLYELQETQRRHEERYVSHSVFWRGSRGGGGGRHELYSFADGYSGYHQVRIAEEDQLKTTFTSLWGTFCYEVMPFGLCNAHATFQRLMNKVMEPYLGHFVRMFIDAFGIYVDRASHLEKLEKVFERLDQ